MQSPPCVRLSSNRLPSWKRNTPAPATSGGKSRLEAEQVLEVPGEFAIARTFVTVNGPSVPCPAKLSPSLLVSGCWRLMVLGAEVPENVIFTDLSSARAATTPRLRISATIAECFVRPLTERNRAVAAVPIVVKRSMVSPLGLTDWVASSYSAHLARIRNRGAKGYRSLSEGTRMGRCKSAPMASCPQCGTELGSDDPAGLCPKCLMQGVFESSLGGSDSGIHTVDTLTAGFSDDDFGRYHILRPLGEGGMGTVYLAEQREPIRRPVALKVVKLGMDTNEVLTRFSHERQALAMMDHPNIARIFDAGATPKGRPYFVMEYIDGRPITQYCDIKRMTIEYRLELFLALCRAVQHAHQKGVIHRDLKPSNVLVMEQEGAHVSKVIDFGIAKATDQWAVEKTLLTQFGQMIGTPEYASPEQAGVLTGDVDESSDVYSLGVILYELLVGAVPYDAASLRQAGLSEMLRIIREEEAPPLSRKLTTLGPAAADIAARRQTDLASLRRLVDGDLNSIAMKALEKTRERRYPSVSELAADLQRYLEHRPVLASPPSGFYWARKFLRRHRPAAFGTAAGLALVLGSGVTVWSVVHRDSSPRPAVANTLANKGTIVLGEIANNTGDPAFNGPLRQVMAGELGKSPYFSVLPDARMNQTLRFMVRPVATKLSVDVASEICERTASAAVVDGSVTSLGSQYVLSLRARNCRTGDILDEEQVPAAKKEDVFAALGQMANRFQKRAGDSLARLPKDTNVQTDVTTPSLEAWRSYKAAMIADINRSKRTESISLLKRATELDPNFAMAYAYMGRSYDAMGEADLGAENISKAFELRNHVSDPENFFITFNYYRQAPRNLELARRTLESW